jgi:hypothetical protein
VYVEKRVGAPGAGAADETARRTYEANAEVSAARRKEKNVTGSQIQSPKCDIDYEHGDLAGPSARRRLRSTSTLVASGGSRS